MTAEKGKDPYNTRGYKNKNPGNLDRVKGVRWQGQLPLDQEVKLDKRFCIFKSHEYGIRAIIRTLITYATVRKARDGSAIDTIKEVIDRWAPPQENDTGAYVKFVADKMGVDPNAQIEIIDPYVMRPLVQAIIAYECNGLAYADGVIDKALAMSGVADGTTILNGESSVEVRPEQETEREKGSTAVKLTGIAGGIAAIMTALSAAVAELPKIVHSIEEAFPDAKASLEEGGFIVNVWDWVPVVLSLMMMIMMVLVYRQIRKMRRPEVVNDL